jgi:putative transposase
MAQSLSKVLLHIVFSTKERRPFLRDDQLRGELHQYMGGILSHLDCQPLLIGGVEDHVHMLSTLARTGTIAEVIKEVKRGSSVWVKQKASDLQDFSWQNGYGVFSLGFSQLPAARDYVERQAEHHKKVSFQDEFRAFLKRYEIDYDERYVWD